MRIPRRFLPSVSLLCAFEAAARHGSITAAANELSLTQGAVSRQIRNLEDQLAVQLFTREKQSIQLTHAGEIYLEDIRSALIKISNASMNVRARPFGGNINLAMLPTFGSRWLAPRIPKFLHEYPGITLNLSTRRSYFSFTHDTTDVAVHFGQPDSNAGMKYCILGSELLLPVCAPGLAQQFNFKTWTDLKSAPLLLIRSRIGDWTQGTMAQNMGCERVEGTVLDQLSTTVQAAISGLGVALLPYYVVCEELAVGRLVQAIEQRVRSYEAYYLVWPIQRDKYPPLTAFRDWVCREISAEIDNQRF